MRSLTHRLECDPAITGKPQLPSENEFTQAFGLDLLRYLNQPTEIKFFFNQCDIIADIAKALRLLQSQFSDSELILRQRVGLKIVGDVIGVGGFTNNGEIARETREIIRSSVNSLFADTRWASMVGELPEQGGFLVLREEIQRDLRCILETVHAWN